MRNRDSFGHTIFQKKILLHPREGRILVARENLFAIEITSAISFEVFEEWKREKRGTIFQIGEKKLQKGLAFFFIPKFIRYSIYWAWDWFYYYRE